MAKEFTAENFNKEVLESEVPVLVDFWAPWCGPCQMIGPVIDSLSTEYEGRCKIGKLSVDDPQNQELAEKYRHSKYPCF